MPAPKRIADVLSQLLARRGYAREQSAQVCTEAWQAAAGEVLSPFTRPGLVRRGVLEVLVANSTLVQELSYQKVAILKNLAQLLPDENIRDLRFRVGPLT